MTAESSMLAMRCMDALMPRAQDAQERCLDGTTAVAAGFDIDLAYMDVGKGRAGCGSFEYALQALG